MLYHLLVFLFHLDAQQVWSFHFKWYVLLLHLTYQFLFEAGYSVSPDIEAWRIALVYTIANVWQFEHKNFKWSSRLEFGNRDFVY
jgi:hypothetical protein